MPKQKDVPKGPSAKSKYVDKLVQTIRNTTNMYTPRNYLKFCAWIPTGREFTIQDGKLEIVQAKQAAPISECDLDCTSDPMEPNSKQFPNTNSSVIGRLSKFVFGSSTRVAPST